MFTSKFKIVEITKTIQGEGYWTGRSVTLIRFQECNLKCSFCDTDRTYAKIYTFEKLLKLPLRSHPNILLTGGEPLFHPAVVPLTEALIEKGHWVQIETNGTFPSRMGKVREVGAWVTCSPKLELTKEIVETCHELKLLVGTRDEVRPLWRKIIDDATFRPASGLIFLQPVWGSNYTQNLQKALDLCRRHPRLFRLSVQVHKLLKCP